MHSLNDWRHNHFPCMPSYSLHGLPHPRSARVARGSQVLQKRLKLTKQQFMLWLGFVVKDAHASDMRRACIKGRERLEQRGLLPREERYAAAWRAALAPSEPDLQPDADSDAEGDEAPSPRELALALAPLAAADADGDGASDASAADDQGHQAPASPPSSPCSPRRAARAGPPTSRRGCDAFKRPPRRVASK